jgi:hypothetical protein
VFKFNCNVYANPVKSSNQNQRAHARQNSILHAKLPNAASPMHSDWAAAGHHAS